MKMKFLLAAATGAVVASGALSSALWAQDAGKPTFGAYGFDNAGKDASIKPGDNFFSYANGTWLKNTPIPADRSNYGMFTFLDDLSKQRTREIIEAAATSGGAPGTEAQKVGDYYKAFMDEKAIEAKGLTPLKADLDAIEAVQNTADLMRRFAVNARRFENTPFVTFVYIDEKQPDTHIPYLSQGGLGLPDRDMYDKSKAQFEAVRTGYKQHIANMLKLAGISDADAKAAAIYALEEKIAAVHWTRVENRDSQKTYNKMTPAELAKLAPGIDWGVWLEGVGLKGVPGLNVNQPSAYAGIAKLVSSEPVSVWKDYLTFHALSDAAPQLPKAFVDENFAFYGKTLTGTPQIKDRWKRGVDGVTGAMGEAVGKLYVTKYFSPETKARAEELVKNLLVAMGKRLDNLAWMSPETKAKAKEKLATYNPKIGYPSQWRDYSKLDVKSDDVLGNARRAQQFEYNRLLAKIGNPVDRAEWGMTPMEVNAYYNPTLNEIVFPAAILQPPFFDPNADDAVNYGGIGAVIGHEISHGFDDQGSQYDAKGALKNWWTDADKAKFKAATDKLVGQYDKYCPFEGQCVKGALTLGENIADLAGLTVAYDAYQLSLKGKPAKTIDGATSDQRFYYGWAQVWRRSYRDQELKNRLVTDPHSPSEYRANGIVRNMDRWYNAFDVKQGDKLYLPSPERIKIW